MTKADTINLKGNEYAKVSERLKLFREDCPNGLITTEPTILDDGQVLFKATVVKDQSTSESASATGHALGKMSGIKTFEKLETVAVGRALAMLGYLASGEIASTEEMAEFLAYKQEKIELSIDMLNNASTIDELKDVFLKLDNKAEKEVIKAKDARKAELNENAKASTK